MDYGSIIKRSWQITWRHKALWVLGLFAGISGGCQGGSGGSNYRAGSGGSPFDGFDANFVQRLEQWLPVIIGVAALVVVIGIVWSILGVAARGGLIVGVNEIEQGRVLSLSQLWGVGFSRFWTLIGLGILLQLPVVVVLLIVLVGSIAPLVGSFVGGGEPGPEAFVPLCGFLGIGIPVLIVLSFILGIVYLIALRYVMLGGQGVLQSAGNAWQLFRARFKDTALMFLINAGLNIAASLALAIPAAIIGIAIAVPLAGGFATGNWTVMVGPIVLGVIVIVVLSWVYAAIWGTYTSSLWTLFFRRVTGMDAPPIPAWQPAYPGQPYQQPGYGQPGPQQPGYGDPGYQPPGPPAPPPPPSVQG